ncbi:unnamed protein product [Adineta ricciae]|uniref:Uncharacterized protein n=1 Tax=Adineta ricciae TaxID=249248 RepID=A0A814WAU2_ADIRI|nr:unnamed protein product [Adineta ricciae]
MAHRHHHHQQQQQQQQLNSNPNVRRPSMLAMMENNPIGNEEYDYDYDLMKLLEQERHFMINQQQASRENGTTRSQQTQYITPLDNIYTNIQQSQGTPQVSRRVLPKLNTTTPGRLSSVKPLRIIIIRHGERADAVLGSEWSKKSFDRHGHYIRFSEHLPDALPARSYLHHYVIDVPLTNRGRLHAYRTGKTLLANGYAADLCYTSPSLRCVQSADKILSGMGRKHITMQLEPGLFECYLNDFKRTLCFMTKDELSANGYNIDRRYKAHMPFMRPYDSQADYYERCQVIMDIIIKRHEATGGTILIVAHAPSLEGLTRHFAGGKFLPEKLFDIARRVPFLAMTILERNGIDSPWLFRTKPLDTDEAEVMRKGEYEMSLPASVLAATNYKQNIGYQGPESSQPFNSQQHLSQIQGDPLYHHHHHHHHHQQQQQQQQQQRFQQIENGRYPSANGVLQTDLKKVLKSSTVPNLSTNNSSASMFRVI